MDFRHCRVSHGFPKGDDHGYKRMVAGRQPNASDICAPQRPLVLRRQDRSDIQGLAGRRAGRRKVLVESIRAAAFSRPREPRRHSPRNRPARGAEHAQQPLVDGKLDRAPRPFVGPFELARQICALAHQMRDHEPERLAGSKGRIALGLILRGSSSANACACRAASRSAIRSGREHLRVLVAAAATPPLAKSSGFELFTSSIQSRPPSA